MPARPLPLTLAWLAVAVGLSMPSTLAAAEAAQAPSLTLEAAIRSARARNEAPQIALARLDRARAARAEAISNLIPDLSLTSTYTRRPKEITRLVNGEELTIQARDALQQQAVADATLFDIRSVPLVRSASRSLRAQELDSSEIVRLLDYDVAETYLAALSAERLLEAAARRVEIAQATVDESRLRLDAGLAAVNDLTRSELELATASLSRTQAQSAVETTRLALADLVAAPVGALSGDVSLENLATTGEDLRAAAAARRDLEAARQRAEAIRQRAVATRLGLVPNLNLRGQYRRTNEAGLTGNEVDWNVAVILGWSLFDGGTRRAQALQRDAEYREAMLQAQALERRIGTEIDRALADLRTAEAAVEQAALRARVASQNAGEVRERFAQGLASALENADAAVAQFEADVALVRQRFAAQLGELALRRAVGQPVLPQLPPTVEPQPASAPEETRSP